ncbi:MAG TPA: hypothetical protein VFJ58_00930 [Armatimonadota bacterium]|nr:hypothetical protein [Armatimonadota bacterium]
MIVIGQGWLTLRPRVPSRTAGVAVLLLLIAGSFNAIPAKAVGQLSNPVFVPSSHKLGIGDQAVMKIDYTGNQNLVPIDAYVELTTPAGTKEKVTTKISDVTPTNNVWTLEFNATPTASGTYEYYYFVRDADGSSQFPDGPPLTFKVQPNWLPWVIMAVGFVLGFLIISTILYQAMHRGMGASQTASARIALMLGAICFMASIFYAWDWLTNVIAWVIGIIVILIIGLGTLFAR